MFSIAGEVIANRERKTVVWWLGWLGKWSGSSRWWRAIGRELAGSSRMKSEGVWSGLSSRKIVVVIRWVCECECKSITLYIKWKRLARPRGSSRARSRF